MRSVTNSENEWRKKLAPQQYNVMRAGGTEPPGSGKYIKKTGDGMYHCAGCGAELFSTKDQFESTEPGLVGWPSFNKAEHLENIELRPDNSIDMRRTEVVCKKSGAHLGHIFDTSDSKTGKHFCINSCALEMKKIV